MAHMGVSLLLKASSHLVPLLGFGKRPYQNLVTALQFLQEFAIIPYSLLILLLLKLS